MSEEIISSSPASTLGSGSARQPKRLKLTDEQLDTISHEDLLKNWRELDLYVDYLESHGPSQEVLHLRECEERIKQQYAESTHREKVLVRRLATKEQEMQDYVSQIAELKSEKAPGAAALRNALLDPAVNLLMQRLRQELIATKARLEETQNELSAWKFTPDSNTGKRLMAKCRLLYQENEELGRIISSGRLAKLEGDLALQKSFSEEVKKSQSELDEFLQDLDEDVEGMQSTIYYLQQELRKAKDELASLQHETEQLKTGPEEVAVEKAATPEAAATEDEKPAASPAAAIAPAAWDSDDSRDRTAAPASSEEAAPPPAKKRRRDSALSLHYSEDEDMLLKEHAEKSPPPAAMSPRTKVSDDDDDDDKPLSVVRRDSQ